MMLFNAGFMNMPEEVIEMSTLTGIRIENILYSHTAILRSLKTVIILQLTGALRAFDLIFVMTGGDPTMRRKFYSVYMFVQAFQNFNIGMERLLHRIFVLSMGLTMSLRKIMGQEII